MGTLCCISTLNSLCHHAERHVRRRRLGHRPVEKDEKSVQKVLLPWRRPRTTPRIENRQIGRPVLRAPKTSIPQRSRPQTVGAGEEAPQSEERGSRDGQARNDQNALENMITVPEMIGAIVGVYNGKVFNTVEIKPEMVGTYLAEYAITYKPISHGRAGIGGDKFIPLK